MDLWTSSTSKNLHWTAAYTLLTGRNISTQERFARVERYPRLTKLMSIDATSVSNAIQAALVDDERQAVAVSIVEALSRLGTDGQPSEFVASLAKECMDHPDARPLLVSALAAVRLSDNQTLKDAVEAEIKARTPAPPPPPQPAPPTVRQPVPRSAPAKVSGPGCVIPVSVVLLLLCWTVAVLLGWVPLL